MPDTDVMDAPFVAAAVGASEALFGDLVNSAELVAKMMPDPSSVSVPAAIGTRRKQPTAAEKKAQREKRQAQVGLASNVLGLAAGGAALGAATGRMRQVSADRKAGRTPTPGPIAERAAQVAGKTKNPRVVRLARAASSPKAVAIGAGSALALQGANVAGDVVANRVLSREAKKDVKKGLRVPRRVVRWNQRRAFQNPTPREAAAGRIATRQAGAKRRRQTLAMGAAGVAGVGALGGYAFGAAPPGEAVPTAEELKTPLEQRGVVGKADRPRFQITTNPNTGERTVTSTHPLTEDGKAWVGPSTRSGVLRRRSGRTPLTDADRKQREALNASIGKADGFADVTWSGEFSKRDDDRRLVFGWANVSEVDGKPVLDRQGDYIPLEEMETAAYQYVIKSRAGGDMHRRDGESALKVSDLVESFIVTPEKLERMGIPSEVAKSVPQGWWVGYHVADDDIWQMVKKGERTGFSIHGKGKRTPVQQVAKAATLTDPQLRRKKKHQAALSATGAVLGLGALGLKGAASASRNLGALESSTGTAGRVLRRVVPEKARITPREGVVAGRRLDRASNTALTFGAGVGGAGGINFAQVQSAESKKRTPRPRVIVVDQDGAPVAKGGPFIPEERRQRRAERIVDGTTLAAGAAAAGAAAQAAPEARAVGGFAARRARRVRINNRTQRTQGLSVARRAGNAVQLESRRVSQAARDGGRQLAESAQRGVADARADAAGRTGRLVRNLASTRGGRAAGLAAGAAGLAAAGQAGRKDLQTKGKPYEPGQWYR